MTLHARHTMAALIVASVATAHAARQSPSPAAAGPSAAIEFFATGPDGVVFDLGAAEVSIKIDGRAREIRSLRFVGLPPADPATSASGGHAIDLPFESNQVEAPGRWVSVIVDHESIRAGAEKKAMSAVARFVQALGPRDQVAYATAPRSNMEIEFTTDHEAVANAFRRFVGSALRQESEQDRSCRSRLLLNAVRDVLVGMARLEGPKLVAVVSSGLLNPRRDAPVNRAPGPCEITLDDFQAVGAAATQAGAHVFVVQPDDVAVDASQAAGGTQGRFTSAAQDREGLESLAGAAAGEFIRIVSADDNTLVSVARATSGYYLATFEPLPSERTGAARRAQVTVQRDGVMVRARRDLVIPKPDDRDSRPASPDEMLRNGLPYRALPLRLAAYPSLGQGSNVNVVAALDSAEPGVKLAAAVFGLFDAKGRLVGKWTANPQQLSSMPLLSAGEVAPGPYRLRAVAVDTSGRRGAVESAVTASLYDTPPLRLSGIVLGTTYDSRFLPKLVFGTDQSAVALLEAYGAGAAPNSLSARLDILSPADSRILNTTAASVSTTSPDRHAIIGTLPIAGLAAGDYVVRVVVSVNGRPVGTVARTLRKTSSGR